jgi:dihydrofolate reductase
MKVNLIAAVGRRGQIGRGEALPWHQPDDLAWFRRQTNGGVLVVGHRTHAGLKASGGLPGRLLCNWSRHHEPGQLLRDIDRRHEGWPVWIAGGAATYRAFAPYVNGLRLLSFIDYDSDPALDGEHVFFPFDAFGFAWPSVPGDAQPVNRGDIGHG